MLKRSVYEDRGVASFWSLDPDEPSLAAWDLLDGCYLPAGTANGEEELSLGRPYPLTVSPRRLAGG